MANSTIPGLVAVSVPALTDLFGVRQSGDSRDKKLTVTQLITLLPGGGDVSKVGTPVDNQIGVWTGDGTIEGDANFTWNGSQFLLPQDDDAVTPTFAFGDGDSGFYENSDDVISVAIAGARRWFFSAGTFGHPSGSGPGFQAEVPSATNPTINADLGDSDTGIGHNADDQVSIIAGGVEIARATEAAGANQFAVVASGASTVPDLTGLADPDTGFRWTGSNEIITIHANVRSWHFLSGSFFADNSDGPILFNLTGSATIPTIVVERSDSNTGLGKAGADQLSLIAGGVEGIRVIETGGLITNQSFGDLLLPAGSASDPSLTWGDGDTGFYQLSDGIINFTAQGAGVWSFRTGAILPFNAAGPAMLNETVSSINPTFAPNASDLNTGLGWNAIDQLSLVAGGVEIARATETVGASQFAVIQSLNTGVPDLTSLGDPDTGFSWITANTIDVLTAGSISWSLSSAKFFSALSDGPCIQNVAANNGVAIFRPDQSDANTGLGANGGDAVSLIAGGIVGLILRELDSGVIQAPDAGVAITAFATGGQGSATPLTRSNNVLTTVATTGDSVRLPSLFLINSVVFVKNDGANAADIFPASGDDLGAGTDTAVSLASGASISFIATVASATWTQWIVSVGGGGGDVTKVGTPADNQVGVWTGDGTIEGTSALVLGASSLDVSSRFRSANGAAGAPSHSFTGETNSGLYLQSSGSVGISCSGGGNWLFQTGSMFANLSGGPQIMFEASTASNPVLNPRLSDTDTGIGSGAADQLNLIAGGLSCLSVRETGSARQIGFYVTAPISLQTGVAVSSAGIHAALVALGLITA